MSNISAIFRTRTSSTPYNIIIKADYGVDQNGRYHNKWEGVICNDKCTGLLRSR
jgi:hypothetical protein